LPTILVDENVTNNIREWLKRKGFKTVNVSDTDLKSAEDSEIAEYAHRNCMTILTLDMDFAQIYYSLYRGKLGVIIVRANPSSSARVLEALIAAQRRTDLRDVKNKLIIIARNRIRIIS
jgi:predicted nuclease of predicted toxin-antitoxin system